MWSEDEVCRALLNAGALTIRDVDSGEEPFVYSSGQRGPGYVMIKALVARQDIFRPLAESLAAKLRDEGIRFDHIAGNATGGMIPAYAVREAFQRQTGRHDIEYVYVRGSRKPGGFGELVTGLQHIPPALAVAEPLSWLVVEDLVNYAETPVNTVLLLRSLGYHAGTSRGGWSPSSISARSDPSSNLSTATVSPSRSTMWRTLRRTSAGSWQSNRHSASSRYMEVHATSSGPLFSRALWPSLRVIVPSSSVTSRSRRRVPSTYRSTIWRVLTTPSGM
jgi:adenine/guanine phosphoribosyltransferase-like PRPP-binding protein